MSLLESLLAANAHLVVGLMLATWVASILRRDASVVDIVWGFGFAAIGVHSAVTGAGAAPRRALIGALAALWGLRLAVYLFWRNHGKGEDYRYQAMRRHWGAQFPVVSLFTVFGLQGVLMWVVSLPLQLAAASTEPEALGRWDAVGAALFALGFFFEVVGDAQLARFKANPANQGQVMDRGLWRYTRHPNYFGDAVLWWGFFAIAAGTPGGWRAVIGPIVMTVLLRRVSGVALLERSLRRRKPGYASYVARTNAFVPGPPRTDAKPPAAS
jgi:steroid 5-alpha reductase family enzyme